MLTQLVALNYWYCCILPTNVCMVGFQQQSCLPFPVLPGYQQHQLSSTWQLLNRQNCASQLPSKSDAMHCSKSLAWLHFPAGHACQSSKEQVLHG
jgi:hypothetical protein